MPGVIPPSPSDPQDSVVVGATFEMQCSATLQSWKWFEVDTDLKLETEYTTGTADFITLDPVSFELSDDLFHFYLNQISVNTTFELDFEQNFTEQFIETEEAATDPADVEGRINNIERDLALSTVNPDYYKEFSYSGDDISGYKVYTSPSKTTEIFDVTFTFTNSLLTEKVITRASDNSVLTVTYGYTGTQLQSQTRSIS